MILPTTMMTHHFNILDDMLASVAGKVAPAIQAVVRFCGEEVYTGFSGWLDPDERHQPVVPDTLYDLASVSKLFTTVAFMHLVEEGRVSLDQPVCTVLPQFSGQRRISPYEDPLHWGDFVQPQDATEAHVDADKVTFHHLLTHTSGLPAWRALKDQHDAAAARKMALETDFFYPTGQHVVYSDIGLILVGMAIEVLSGMRLDEAVHKWISAPLGLERTCYLPVEGQPYDTSRIAPTEFCTMRNYRVWGEVHDENAFRLGGIAGHAGVFSTANELARFGQALLDGGPPLLQPATLAEMVKVQAQEGNTRRGIGFLLWSPDPQASSHPFSYEAFGHTGFTGTSLWMDPHNHLVVALLTNRVYYGRDAAAITRFRVDFHKAVIDLVARTIHPR
jgi:CubicO group peptidase (beta-lactamase class C family)